MQLHRKGVKTPSTNDAEKRVKMSTPEKIKVLVAIFALIILKVARNEPTTFFRKEQEQFLLPLQGY